MSSAEPAYCPSCELRHTRRPDWLCPRCGMPVDTATPPPRVRARAAEPGFPLGSRIAGAATLLAAGALATALVRTPGAVHRWPLLAAAIVLALLGLAVLLAVPATRWVAVAGAVAVALVVAEGALRERLPDLISDPVPAAIRAPLRDLIHALWPARLAALAAFDVAGLLLLLGRPRALRIATGALLALPLLALAVLRAIGR